MNERKEIESFDFSVRTQIASDLDQFWRIVELNPSVSSLLDRARQDTPTVIDILVAMRHLRNVEFDPKYENPMDAAMTTYGWIISKARPRLSGLTSDLLDSLDHSWWARRLATSLRSEHLSM